LTHGKILLFGTLLVAAAPLYGAELPDFKTHFKMPEYQSRKQWETRRQDLQQQILSAAGLLPQPAKTPLRPKVVRHLEYEDYAIESILLETMPGYFLGGNLYLPLNKKSPAPAVLIPHGHWKRGRLEDQPSYSVPALGINLARQGYIAFAYDMVGFNDTRQTAHSFGGWSETLWGFSPMGLQLWNSIRAVDYVQSRPGVDVHRIAVTGASGGGTQTFLLAAVDDRITAAAPVNMVSAYMQGGDPCEEAPSLRVDTFNVEIAAMMAPRPMLIVSSTHDWTRHTPIEEYPEIKQIYGLYGAAQNVQNAHIDAEHNYNRQSREAVYRFLACHLRSACPTAGPVDEDVSVPKDEDLLAFPKSGARDLDSYSDVFQSWQIAGSLSPQRNDANAQRDALRITIGAKWPAVAGGSVRAHQALLSQPDSSDTITGYWIPGKGVPVLIVHPSGHAAALRTPAVAQLQHSGRPVLFLDPHAESKARAQRAVADRYFLSYNRSLDAERVQDILTAAAWLSSKGAGKVEMIGLGNAGVWCVFAAAIAPVPIDLTADLSSFGGSDQDFRDRFFVPGIQRAGGLSAALKLINRLRTLDNSTEPSGFVQVLTTLQRLQQSDRDRYQQMTAQVAADLQTAAERTPEAADQLLQLAKDFTEASKTGRLPNVENLARAIDGHLYPVAHTPAIASESDINNQ
jgi:dienelactone hydrolase